MKFVYVLVSSPKDIYLEQAYVSMYSLRYYMPEAHITLLTDRLTSETFTDTRKHELKYANEIVVVDLDGDRLNAQQRSRQLKTSVRNHIKGDFLFIDCDTIIIRPLNDIVKTDAVIAACRDTHTDLKNHPYYRKTVNNGRALGWPIDEEIDYYNSGVLYVKDVPETHEFYEKWNENLNSGYKKKVYMDQPSFAKTNYEMGHIVKMLPDVWNCELKHGIRYLKDAYIVHYLTTNPSKKQNKQLFLLNEQDTLLEVKKTGEISDIIKEVVKDPFYGLAELTHCFAGDDVFFFQSNGYVFMRNHFQRGKRSIADYICNVLNYIERRIK